MITFARLNALMTAMAHTSAASWSSSIVLGGVRPDLVGDTTAVGDPGALLGQLQGSTLGVGEHRGLAPRRDQVQARRGLPGVRRVLGVHVEAETTAIDLAGANPHQFLRRGRQGRVIDDRACRRDVLDGFEPDRVVEEVQASIHV